MKLRKRFALILTMIMLVSLMAGCSSAEWGYYNLSQEMNKLDKYQVTGEMGATLDNINPEVLGEDVETVSQIQSILNTYSLTFDAEVDTKASKLIFTYYFKNKNSGEQQEIMKVQSDGTTVYAKVDGLFNFMKGFGNEELNTGIDQLFADVQYLSINRDEMKELLVEAYAGNEELAELVTKVYFDFGTFTEQNKEWTNIFEGLMKDVYDEYEMGIIKEDQNKYIMNLTVESAINIFASFANYSMDNIDAVSSYLKTSIDNLNDSQKQLLSLYGIDASTDMNAVKQQIDAFTEDVKANKEAYKSSIDLMVSYAEDPNMKKVWEGTEFKYSVEKTDEGAYVADFNGLLNFADPTTGDNMLKASFIVKETVKEIDSVSITAPTENILTVNELMEIVGAAAVQEPIETEEVPTEQ